MVQITIQLIREIDGSLRVAGDYNGQRVERTLSAEVAEAAQQKLALIPAAARRDRAALSAIGAELRDVFLHPFYDVVLGLLKEGQGRLLFASDRPEFLRLPWELLPWRDGQFLSANDRWALVRSSRSTLLPPSVGLGAPPLRMVFCACAPVDAAPADYEQEEEAMVRLAHQLGGKVHIEIAETGSFEEVRELVAGIKPQIVHLAGHCQLKGRMPQFLFEDERGLSDPLSAPTLANGILAGQGVRLLTLTGGFDSQEAAAAMCETLTATNQVPTALTWATSMAEIEALEFSRIFLHELVHGRSVEWSLSVARKPPPLAADAPAGEENQMPPRIVAQQLYAAEDNVNLVDAKLRVETPLRPAVRHEILADNICGLAEGFVGRRRLLQRAGPALWNGEKHLLLLTGVDGSGRSTLAARLAAIFKERGFETAAAQPRRNDISQFRLRLLAHLAEACGRLGKNEEKAGLSDGQRPVAERLKLAVEILNRAKILLVLDNVEELLPPPPAPQVWTDPEMRGFFAELTSGLKGEGRVILTCNRAPETFDLAQATIAHELLPPFTSVDFFKYIRRYDLVAGRLERGDLDHDLVMSFHRKLGITPRFVRQAAAVLSKITSPKLKERLEKVPDGLDAEAQQACFCDQFLADVYNGMPPEVRWALSRLALVQAPLPLDGVARVGGLERRQTEKALADWCASGLVLQFAGEAAKPLHVVHPLQQAFFRHPSRLPADQLKAGHAAIAAFFQDCFEVNREAEMRLSVAAGLLFCLQHATEAGDGDRRYWAAVRLSRRMQGTAEFREAKELIEQVLRQGAQSES